MAGLTEEVAKALSAALDALDSHDPGKVQSAKQSIHEAFSKLKNPLDMTSNPTPPASASNARALIGQALAIVAGVAAVVGLLVNLLDNRISDLGARVSQIESRLDGRISEIGTRVATVEARLVTIDSGIADVRVQNERILAQLQAMNQPAVNAPPAHPQRRP